MKTKVTPFLMFEGKAEEAMQFYVSLLADSRIDKILRYGPAQAGAEGTVMLRTPNIAAALSPTTDLRQQNRSRQQLRYQQSQQQQQ